MDVNALQISIFNYTIWIPNVNQYLLDVNNIDHGSAVLGWGQTVAITHTFACKSAMNILVNW